MTEHPEQTEQGGAAGRHRGVELDAPQAAGQGRAAQQDRHCVHQASGYWILHSRQSSTECPHLTSHFPFGPVCSNTNAITDDIGSDEMNKACNNVGLGPPSVSPRSDCELGKSARKRRAEVSDLRILLKVGFMGLFTSLSRVVTTN